jgi:serine/threonine-protein kinase
MGEVWRATDTRLGRDVALKLLPAAFASDPDRLARFEREAKLLASLSHTHIAGLFALEEAPLDSGATPVRFLAMELAEGDDLAARLKRGAIPVEEAISIAKQIAEALEAAHEKGIVHRDLKPANVKVSAEGHVKVLDFGLAKAWSGEVDGASDSADWSQSPTLARTGTAAGLILGTAPYMSPEQARGKPVDKRADVWAFGVVLFEMLTAKRLFDGETVSDVLAAVLTREPQWNELPAATPERVRELLRRCLRKDPKQRLRDAGDARLELEDARAADSSVARGSPSTRPFLQWSRALPWVLTLATIGIAALVVGSRSAPGARSQPAHLQIVLPAGLHLAVETEHPALALSPDGRRLVFVAAERGIRRLYVRELADSNTRAIPGTEDAVSASFSPEGGWIGFFDAGILKKVSTEGGMPVAVHAVTPASVNRGATWSSEGTVIYAPSPNSGLAQVDVSGEAKRPFGELKPLVKENDAFAWPDAVPGGRFVLFGDHTLGRLDEARVAVLSLQSGATKSLFGGGTSPRFSRDGYVVFARAGSLFAVPFDAERGELRGHERKLVDGVVSGLNGSAQFAVAVGGTLAYIAGSSAPPQYELVFVDSSGSAQSLLDDGRWFGAPRVSPDGRSLAVNVVDGSNVDVWLLDLSRRSLSRVTTDPGEDFGPVWSPDGKQLGFSSEMGENALQGPGLARIDLGGGRPELLLRQTGAGNWSFPASWSPDGRWIAFVSTQAGGERSIRMLPMRDGQAPSGAVATPADETAAAFSPDGRWLAYVSDESGRQEVYVQPFPGPGSRTTISSNGGREPVWSRDGRKLFYREGDRLMAVPIGAGPTLAAGAPQLLFEGRFEQASDAANSAANYDVMPDGRFVMVRRKNPVAPTVIDIVLDWPTALLSDSAKRP